MSLFTLPSQYSYALKLVMSALRLRDTLEKGKGGDFEDLRPRVSRMGLCIDQKDIK